MPKFASTGCSRNQYHCAYCDRKFRDSRQARKRHLQSLSHKRARTEHYEGLKSAQQRWSEERNKASCRAFAKDECPFGITCKYSHMTQEDRHQLEQRALLEAMMSKSFAPVTDAQTILYCWLAKRRPDLIAVEKLRKRLKEQQNNSALWPPSLRLLFAKLQAN
uniref:C3H1-type domain-containing protein n=1 Tax=Trichuris muris TaxID=70415 RepID=A0A5S6R0R8_TRIMR